jgi:hypothetical protein
LARIFACFVAVSVAVFFLQQIPVESPAVEEALEWECLPAAESIQAAPARLPPLAAAEAVNPPEELRAAEKPQPLPSGFLMQLQPRSTNTIAGAAGK